MKMPEFLVGLGAGFSFGCFAAAILQGMGAPLWGQLLGVGLVCVGGVLAAGKVAKVFA